MENNTRKARNKRAVFRCLLGVQLTVSGMTLRAPTRYSTPLFAIQGGMLISDDDTVGREMAPRQSYSPSLPACRHPPRCASKGPSFKIKLELQNQGERALTNLPVAFSYDRDIYSMERGQFIVSTLLPVSRVIVSYAGGSAPYWLLRP